MTGLSILFVGMQVEEYIASVTTDNAWFGQLK
jgi:hypothetical protein